MKEWFEGLEARERMILSVGFAAALIIVLWGFVWLPLTNGTGDLHEAIAEKRALLVDIQRAEALPAAASRAAPVGDGRSLVVLVDQTAGSMGLRFSRTRPDGPNAINVSFTAAPFDTLVSWLVTLERDHGITVESASFNSTRERGLVSGQLSLRRF